MLSWTLPTETEDDPDPASESQLYLPDRTTVDFGGGLSKLEALTRAGHLGWRYRSERESRTSLAEHTYYLMERQLD